MHFAKILEWDSDFFGFSVARARDDLRPDMVPQLLAECEAKAIRCLYFLADLGNADILAILERHGFELKDVRVTLRHPQPTSAGPPDSGVRPVVPADVDTLRWIARISHRDSRFYFDSGFPRDRCDDLYDTWITKSCCAGYADLVLVLPDSVGKAAGYVTCSIISPQRGQFGLVAVAPEVRGTGAGRRLIQAALAWFARQGAVEVITVTQGRNAPAIRAYERCGFITDGLQLWYHRWFSSPA